LKAVFDTNVFVSALAIPGAQAERAIDLVIDARVNLCISKAIIHEVLGVLAQKFSKGCPEQQYFCLNWVSSSFPAKN
jgi:putative PIN family toxin of toxin-antitoxin system